MTRTHVPLNVDSARQAIHAIRGYEYQILAAALAWVDLEEGGLIYLEVAEDYAQVIGSDIEAVQVKATHGTGGVTLNTPAVRDSIESFVNLTLRNPGHRIQLRFFTTSAIGLEKSPNDRPSDLPGLEYWQRVRAGQEEVGPLRTILEGPKSSETLRAFCKTRTDEELRADLIRRITWDCGQPETATLRLELEGRVGLLLRKEFGVPIHEASPVTDVLTCRVLQRSAMAGAQNRILSRRELRELIDFSTRLAVPRADFERILSKALATSDTSTPRQAIISHRGDDFPPWLINADALPTPAMLIRRKGPEALARSALKDIGVCFVVGPTGTGKSYLTRCVADAFPGTRYWVDLRDTTPSEARSRLKQVFILLAEMGPATLMLEDLNCLAAQSVQVSLGEVIGTAQRHDMRIVVTSYLRPATTVLSSLGIKSGSIVTIPHFEPEETKALVSALDGDPETWGHVAHLAGGAGHPQLTHAFAAGMAARGWPVKEIAEMVARGFTNNDLEDEHSLVRSNLIESLRGPARELLYRLSITTAPFERSLALAIGALQPPIERAGECFDELTGRWLEIPMADRYRTSPLIRGLGKKMLTTAMQHQVHNTIATAMTTGTNIDAGNIDTILVHGLAGASESALFKLTAAINLADDETREAVTRYLAAFPALDTSKPIYPDDLPTSVMLRLAQLRLVVVAERPTGVDAIVHALLREAETLPHDLDNPDLRIAILVSALNNLGIARHLRNWVELLSYFRRLDEARKDVVTRDRETPPTAELFSIGIAGLDSVETLESIFEALSGLDDEERHELLTPIDASFRDYHLLIHHPWTARSRQPGFHPEEAIESYLKMAAQADSWGMRTISVQCRIAIATIVDEHLGETTRALSLLNKAATAFGEDPVLARALAKLHRRAGNRGEALRYYRDVVSQLDAFGPVDAVYTVREAAVCAAEGEDWSTACTWFLRAQAVSGPLDSIDLGTIGVGLLADAAVASFEAGDLRGALEKLRDALRSLAKFKPDLNLQSAHCHRLVRHTILWLQAKVQGLDTKVEGEPIAMRAGACSNPEPLPAIEQRPLGHIDLAWYMLAEIELATDLDVGARRTVNENGVQGHIPISEHTLRTAVLTATIAEQNPIEFSSRFFDYLASATYCTVNREAIRKAMSVLNPQRAAIPDLPHEGPFNSVTERSAHHAILAYIVRSLLAGGPSAVGQLRDVLRQELGSSHPGIQMLDNWDTASLGTDDLDGEVSALLRHCLTSRHPPPNLVFRAGLRLMTWIDQSPFKSALMPLLKPWLKEQWRRILRTQRFLLYSPGTTTPPIEEMLRSELGGQRFAASVTLAAAPAVQARLSPALRVDVERLVRAELA